MLLGQARVVGSGAARKAEAKRLAGPRSRDPRRRPGLSSWAPRGRGRARALGLAPRPPVLPAPPPSAIPPCPLVRAMEGLVLRPAKDYRVVLLGSVAVGKTALATQFACGRFPERCEPSVEELFSKVIEVNRAPALLEIVDTVGAEHLVTLKDLYIRNSDGFVVLYSVCDEASFQAVRPLRERMGRLRGSRAIPLVLVGTKADIDAERRVLTAEGRELAREWRCPFLEITAKSKMMVDRVFTQVVREMEALAPPGQEAPRIPANALETWPAERFIG